MGVAHGPRSGLISDPHGRHQSGGPRGTPVPGETRAACAFTFDMDAETSRAFHASMNGSTSSPITEPV